MHTFVKRYSFVFVHVAANTQPMFPYAIFLCLAVVCKCVFISFFFFHFFICSLFKLLFFHIIIVVVVSTLICVSCSLSFLITTFLFARLCCVQYSLVSIFVLMHTYTQTHTTKERAGERKWKKRIILYSTAAKLNGASVCKWFELMHYICLFFHHWFTLTCYIIVHSSSCSV